MNGGQDASVSAEPPNTTPFTPSEDGDSCRICRGEATPELPLFYPCQCSGSIKYVHQDCLMEWLSHSHKKHCELCKTPFRFTKLYDHSMPGTLPMAVFLRRLGFNIIQNCLRWARYVLVGVVWLGCLPWSIRQIWRALFWLADGRWALGVASPSPSVSSDPMQLPRGLGWLLPVEKLLGGLARLITPELLHLTGSAASLTPTSSERGPSLLSDVKYLGILTPYQSFNHVLLDILEGQLISICVVTTFILIFLIREWVINQHPAQDPADLNEEAGGEAQRQIRRETETETETEPEVPGSLQANSPEAAAETVAVPVEQETAADSQATTVSGSGPPTPETRPPLPDRNALDDANSIRRTIEEERASPKWPGLETFKNLWGRAQGDPKEVLRLIREEKREEELEWVVVQMEKLERNKSRSDESESPSGVHLAGPEADSEVSQSIEGLESILRTPPDSLSVDDQTNLTEDNQNLGPDILVDMSPTLDDASSVFTEQELVEADQEARGRPDHSAPGASSQEEVEPTSLFDAVANWLWKTDEPAPSDLNEDEDDENIVDDIEHEARFVPVAPEVQEQDEAVADDLDDPEFIDEAEDLDGILDLIGIQGPLAGMLQNVVFSGILITLTLAGSVWLPYIWGKVTLLVLSNPIGVFVRAPLYLVSNAANTLVDILIFFLGINVYAFDYALSSLSSYLPPIFPKFGAQRVSFDLASGSGSRLENSVYEVVSSLKPDLPTFSALSHQVLLDFQHQIASYFQAISHFMVDIYQGRWFCGWGQAQCMWDGARSIDFASLAKLPGLRVQLGPELTTSIDYSLIEWGTRDRILAVLCGYALFATLGYLFMKTVRLIWGLRKEDKVEGVVADSLTQAGGVTKVILIIGIEMIVFPLYCGLLLDVALMPLFEGAGIDTRAAFVFKAPLTALFVHWFVGTCYMFHFALFVSMCRKILRKGVLYFIRDPDDPTFHPVRDVLERSVATQLSKIAFSGLVYGGLVILCLGGIVWLISCVEGIFPIHWTSNEPLLDFPIDLLSYNLLMPVLIRRLQPSKKLHAMYAWWFRKCARYLRLTNFMFGDEMLDERGRHVRRSWASFLSRKQGRL